ncbi:hypothetical protein D9611_014940 [Ephemerocybe angulata]|uniref:Uncharacterized protein n=1 Tax=Ephemerocybe angulata TaxID=980116 RepID=A0A8H5C4R9_9AGAR|nr:hypothetical protein D9611_014940 [Tulosesus angulatus]
MPDAVRVYPASAGTIMLPLTPANNWTATILFCGGSAVATERWQAPDFIAIQQHRRPPALGSPRRFRILYPRRRAPEARSMLNFIQLPDGTILGLNGAATGSLTPYFHLPMDTNPGSSRHRCYGTSPGPQANRQRFSRNGFSASAIPRMYHSSATLLPDGSVMVTGSNPNADHTTGVKPQPKALPTKLTYGGPSFNVQLTSDDLFGTLENLNKTTAVLIRTGFSTHAMNMGQRFVELQTSFTGFHSNTSAILHVSQVPPNPALLAPGPALLFIVVNGVPSVGVQVMVGSGNIEPQQTLPVITSLHRRLSLETLRRRPRRTALRPSGVWDFRERLPKALMVLGAFAGMYLTM